MNICRSTLVDFHLDDLKQSIKRIGRITIDDKYAPNNANVARVDDDDGVVHSSSSTFTSSIALFSACHRAILIRLDSIEQLLNDYEQSDCTTRQQFVAQRRAQARAREEEQDQIANNDGDDDQRDNGIGGMFEE